ncbi:recombinase family protein [Herbidospora sp. NBRC 101105]|uniref:recombinase family protein n=1 Tax=Herbidospora sp. NBRC 101105 TaxID=3032195 RepID=UPI0025565FD8|nr:recombinase family protein [Herbidospora sp. NBRC 101105]
MGVARQEADCRALVERKGWHVVGVLGAAARHEAEHKAERPKRQRRQNAEAGKVSGGGLRPYGYGDDRVTVIEEEAAIIREAARRALAGESLSRICRDFEQRDVRTPGGGHWIPTTLRRLLASARISGRREHSPRSASETTRPLLGEIVADAVWPSIITAVDSDRLRALLNDPARDYHRQAATGRTYLLSGILRCGRCGHRMNGRPRSGVPRYVCPNVPGSGSCGGIATNTTRTDDHVRDMLLTALDSPTLAQRIRSQTGDNHNLAELVRTDEEQLEELAEAWASRKEWMAARAHRPSPGEEPRRARQPLPPLTTDHLHRHRRTDAQPVESDERLPATRDRRRHRAHDLSRPRRPTQEVGPRPLCLRLDRLSGHQAALRPSIANQPEHRRHPLQHRKILNYRR